MNKYIHKLIREQFNISDLDFSDDEQEYNVNIFNKEYNHPYYKNVLDGTATEDLIKELNSLVYAAAAKDNEELRTVVKYYTGYHWNDSLNWLDVSGITDMSHLFEHTTYNGDISRWNTSNVTDMSYMFNCEWYFDLYIGDWDVSNVKHMISIF